MTLSIRNNLMLTGILYIQIIPLQNQVIEIQNLYIGSIVKILVFQDLELLYQIQIIPVIKINQKDEI